MKTEDLYEGKGIFGRIFQWEKRQRFEFVLKHVGNGSILEVGSREGELVALLRSAGHSDVTGSDLEPLSMSIKKADIRSLPFPDKSFDTVIALCVLEHLSDPTKAMSELRRVCRKQLIIAVPNEPWFTFWRFMSHCPEHLSDPSRKVLRSFYGAPAHEKTIALKREYVAEWLF